MLCEEVGLQPSALNHEYEQVRPPRHLLQEFPLPPEQVHYAVSGPRSGGNMDKARFICFCHCFFMNKAAHVSEPRVSLHPMGGLEAGPQGLAKFDGERPFYTGSPGFSSKVGRKRAYRRACQRASRNPMGGTWYRGRRRAMMFMIALMPIDTTY